MRRRSPSRSATGRQSGTVAAGWTESAWAYFNSPRKGHVNRLYFPEPQLPAPAKERRKRDGPVTVKRGRGSPRRARTRPARSEEHTSELQSLMRISYAVFCLKKKQRDSRDQS